jgi:ribonuclease E
VAEHAITHEDHDDGLPEAAGFEQQPRREGAPQAGEGGDTPEGRRRRRRGRRGGRRNKHRNGEAPFQGGESRPESDVQSTAPDLGQPPRYDSPPPVEARSAYDEPAPSPESRPAAPSSPIEAQPSENDRAEPPRRRSTIREPAPIAAGVVPAPVLPPSAPVISSTASDAAGTPKRGWWGKRLLGDKD